MKPIYKLALATSFILAGSGCSFDENGHRPHEAEKHKEVQELVSSLKQVDLPSAFNNPTMPIGVYEIKTEIYGENQRCLANVLATHRGKNVILTNCQPM